MYRVEVFEYIKKYKRFNRICMKELNLLETVDFIRFLKDLDLLFKGYKVVIRPVDPDEFWEK